MKLFVRTNAGESLDSYHHSEDYFKGSEGQGKTPSPCNWLFTSSTLLSSLEEQCKGLYLTSADGKFVSKRVTEGYIDDTAATPADQRTQNVNTPQSIAARMTIIAQTWADLVYGLGGDVLMPTSCWWLVWWSWKGGKASMATVAEVDAQVKL
eukprot:2321287-Ditylum_brightwellii.AAC.1